MLAITIFIALLTSLSVIWWGPKWQVARSQNLSSKNRFDRENEARKTLAQIVGGVFLLAGIYSSVQAFRLQTQSVDLQREGQITDRYIRAVQQLGSTDAQNLPVRIGAIFALERIAHESKADYWPIMELLSAYVRNRSGPHLSREQIQTLQHFAETMPIGSVEQLGNAFTLDKHPYTVLRESLKPDHGYDYERSWPNEPAPEDIQAAMTVIGRRQLDYEGESWRPLNLRFVNLRGLELKGAHLEGADLEGANLQETDLSGACLCGANLRNVLMDSTRLNKTDLRRADLTGAVFLNTRDHGADLREAIIEWAGAPPHETKETEIGLEDSDTQGLLIGERIHPLKGSIQLEEDREISVPTSFPRDRPNSSCLQRSAQVLLSGTGK